MHNEKVPTERRIKRIAEVVARREGGLTVILEDIHDPHNAEAILRTCDALGIQDVYFVFNKEKKFNPGKVGKKTSSSANKWLTFHVYTSIRDCIRHLRGKGYEIVATVLDARAEDFYKAKFGKGKIALLVGNEHRGLSDEAKKLATRSVTMPMRGMVESLNVSVSAAIFLYEIVKSRIRGRKACKLTSIESKRLTKDLLSR